MDEKLIDEFITDKRDLIAELDTGEDDVYKALEQLLEIMSFENNGTNFKLVDFLTFCGGATTHTDSSVTFAPSVGSSANEAYTTEPQIDTTSSLNSDESTLTGRYPWLQITSQEECDEAYRKFKNHINDTIVKRYHDIRQDREFSIFAEDFLQQQDPEYINQRNERRFCFEMIEERKNATDYLITVLRLIDNMRYAALVEGLAAIEGLLARRAVTELYDLYEYCDGLLYYSGEIYEKAVKDKANITLARQTLLTARNLLSEWYFNLVWHDMETTFFINSMVGYLAKNITKKELAEQFLSEQNVSKREGFLQNIKSMDGFMQEFEQEIYQVLNLMWQGYGNLREDKSVIINDSSVHRLELIRKALTVDDLSDSAREGDLWNICFGIQEMMNRTIKHVKQDIMTPMLLMPGQFKKVESNLREYLEAIKMDTQFYL